MHIICLCVRVCVFMHVCVCVCVTYICIHSCMCVSVCVCITYICIHMHIYINTHKNICERGGLAFMVLGFIASIASFFNLLSIWYRVSQVSSSQPALWQDSENSSKCCPLHSGGKRIRTCTYMFTYIEGYIHSAQGRREHLYLHTYTYTYIHTCINATNWTSYLHVYIHTCIRMYVCNLHTCYVLTNPPSPSSRCKYFVVFRPV